MLDYAIYETGGEKVYIVCGVETIDKGGEENPDVISGRRRRKIKKIIIRNKLKNPSSLSLSLSLFLLFLSASLYVFEF